MKWVIHDLRARDFGGAMVKKLGTHRSKTQCASTEINLWSRSLFYINFQVLWARFPGGFQPHLCPEASPSHSPELLRLALGPVCTWVHTLLVSGRCGGSALGSSLHMGPHPPRVWEVGALSPRVQWAEQQEQVGQGLRVARRADALWEWWGLCPRLGWGQPGQGGACARA